MSRWIGGFTVKTGLEVRSGQGSVQSGPDYGFVGLCSGECRRGFWKAVFDYPLTEIGTDVALFGQNVRKLWHAAILYALSCTPHSGEAIAKVKNAIQIETEDFKAIPLGISDDGTVEKDNRRIRLDFIDRAYTELAQNLEKSGRPLDAAAIYGKKLKLYDKARQLRKKRTFDFKANPHSRER